jgi:hypothetical protein
MKNEVFKRNEFVARILDAYDEKHAIFAHVLQSSLELTVVFSNIYCEL